MSILEKFASFIGLIGFAMLVPGILYALGNPAAIELCQTHLGMLGDPSVMTVISFGLIFLAIFFGGGENISATIMGLVTGFFFISTAVQIGFMQWFRDVSSSWGFLDNLHLNYLVGISVVFLGLFFSFFKKIKFVPQVIVLVTLPIAFLVTADMYKLFKVEQEFSLSIDKGFEDLSQAIDKKYRSMPAVVKFIEDLQKDEELSKEEREAKVEELKESINRFEDDNETLEALKKQNEAYKKLLEQQEAALSGIGWCASSKDSSHQAKSYAEAVVPNQPCVRDFAVSLVKNDPGSFDGPKNGRPSKVGIRQICDVHLHLSTNWKYVSDPTLIMRDYNSPADRTLAIGMAGDCDDYSILMASSVEAIGGVTRIMAGECDGGGHAWAEVLIGYEQEWDEAKAEIKRFYKRSNMDIVPSIDEDGRYWLPLDWRMGHFTCNDYPTTARTMYEPNARLWSRADLSR